jgi:hypothetical protein
MKYVHVKGLELQNRNQLVAPNWKIRKLILGEEVDLKKEEADDILACCLIKPAKEEKKKPKKQEEKKLIVSKEE